MGDLEAKLAGFLADIHNSYLNCHWWQLTRKSDLRFQYIMQFAVLWTLWENNSTARAYLRGMADGTHPDMYHKIRGIINSDND